MQLQINEIKKTMEISDIVVNAGGYGGLYLKFWRYTNVSKSNQRIKNIASLKN